jgi:hypothetical protein
MLVALTRSLLQHDAGRPKDIDGDSEGRWWRI